MKEFTTFTEKKYIVNSTGSVFSEFSGREVGRQIGKQNNRIVIDMLIDLGSKVERKTIQRSRLIFFHLKYLPEVLKKQSGTFSDFINMPQIVHLDGNVGNDKISNLKMMASKHEVAIWCNQQFGHLYKRNKRKSSITGKDAELAKMLLKKGKGYKLIASLLKIKVSDMAVYRFAIANGFKKRAKPCLTKKQKEDILKQKGKVNRNMLAQKYGINPATVNRIQSLKK